jgi:8-oxo-dGTP diphosphatase
VAAGIVWLGGRVLVQRRGPHAQHGAGRLELPGGKLEEGESSAMALTRELVEEWGAAAAELVVGARVMMLRHRYPPPGPDVLLLIHVVDAGAWPAEGWDGRLVLDGGAQVLAYVPQELPEDDFLEADRAAVRALREGRHRL